MLKRRRSDLPAWALAGVASLACGAAWAQYARASGEFRGPGLQVLVVALDTEAGVAAVRSVVSQGTCSGTLAGLGRFEGRTLVVQPYAAAPGDSTCRLQLQFDPDWRTVRAQAEGCTTQAGAGCGWAGQTAQRR